MKVVIISIIFLCAAGFMLTTVHGKEFECAQASQVYPPPETTVLPSGTINLDLAPEQRWVALSRQYAPEIHALMGIIKKTFGKYAPMVYALVDRDFDNVWKKMPEPYKSEIRGVAEGSKLTLGEATLYSAFYSVFTACTSIVAQDDSEQIYHARNLDFGIFPLWNGTDDDWEMTVLLKPLLIDLDFQRGGQTVFRSAGLVGFVGILSAMRPDGYAVTIDDLFDMDFDSGLINWFHNPDDGAKFVTLFLRDLFESVDNYDDALAQLQSQTLVSPVYFIVSGAKPGQGAVVSREKNETLNLRTLSEALADNSFYVLETNYANYPNENGTIPPPPFFDQRRTAAEQCLNATSQADVSFPSLFAVLDTKPVRNRLTVYSILMSAQQDNHWQVWQQDCEPPCAFW
jgi:acid ceramidase